MLVGKSILILVLLGTLMCGETWAFEPVSGISAAAVAGLASLAYSTYSFLKCHLGECSSRPWIINNQTGLLLDLQNKLYGQHLVVNAVYKHFKGHLNPDLQPVKALSLSFHGWMGTGKNYVAKIIAENLYKKGMKSEFVHLISGSREFPHVENMREYKEKIQALVESNVKKCPQSLFIFDEMEKVPGGLIDTLQPYLQPYEELHGVDYRRAIFLFLSNSAGNEIAERAYQHWLHGKNRELLTLAEMEPLIEKAALFTKGGVGLADSSLILNHLLTASIPFLPLNRTHVRQCVRDQLQQRGISNVKEISRDLEDKVISNLHFQPEPEGPFSTSGCKRVAEKLNYVIFDS